MKMTKHEFSAATQYQLLLAGDWSGENVFTIPRKQLLWVIQGILKAAVDAPELWRHCSNAAEHAQTAGRQGIAEHADGGAARHWTGAAPPHPPNGCHRHL